MSRLLASLGIAGLSFATGWLVSELNHVHKVQRITEEREAAILLAKTAMATSQRALEYSVGHAEVLQVCLDKMGLKQPAHVSRMPVLAGQPAVLREVP